MQPTDLTDEMLIEMMDGHHPPDPEQDMAAASAYWRVFRKRLSSDFDETVSKTWHLLALGLFTQDEHQRWMKLYFELEKTD